MKGKGKVPTPLLEGLPCHWLKNYIHHIDIPVIQLGCVAVGIRYFCVFSANAKMAIINVHLYAYRGYGPCHLSCALQKLVCVLALWIAAHQARISQYSFMFGCGEMMTILRHCWCSCEAEGPIAEYDLLHSLFNWKPVGNWCTWCEGNQQTTDIHFIPDSVFIWKGHPRL